MPNINGQHLVSQNLLNNPFTDPNAHYIYTNYLQPLLFKLFGGSTLNQYLVYTLLNTLAFFAVFFLWFLKQDNSKNFHKSIAIIIFPVFTIPFYWIGMDGMTLLLMLLIMINMTSKLGLVFAILLGLQHFEQGLVGCLILFGSLVMHRIISAEDHSWQAAKKVMYIIGAIVLGKLLLSLWFSINTLVVLGDRAAYLESHLDTSVTQWLGSWPYILFSIFGFGWLLILKNAKTTYPLLIAALVAFVFVITVKDQSRVAILLLFPSLFYWVFINRAVVDGVSAKHAVAILALYLLFPTVIVWEGEIQGALLKADRQAIQAIKQNSFDYDFFAPFQKRETGPFNSIIYHGADLSGTTGAIIGSDKTASKNSDQPGYVTYGPYAQLPEGKYRFIIAYSSPASNTTTVGNWDVMLNLPNGAKLLNKGLLVGTDNTQRNITDTFILATEYAHKKIEIRNFYNGASDLSINSVTITRLGE
jgi:hypothetical protein